VDSRLHAARLRRREIWRDSAQGGGAERRRQVVERERRLWEIPYDRAVKLGLSRRIRIDASSLETTIRKLPSAETTKHPPAETSPRSPS
jgi:hypothetical protein